MIVHVRAIEQRPGRGDRISGRSGEPPPRVAILDNPRPACACPPPRGSLGPAFPTEREMHRYRSHTCGALREADAGQNARLSGWCNRIRDHGGVLFIDLRDHYGITQCVVDPDSPAFAEAERLRSETVVRVDGQVRRRPAGHRECRHGDGQRRALRRRHRGARPRCGTAAAGRDRPGIPGGDAPPVPLPRPAPRAAARQHHAARAGDRTRCARA